MFLIVNHYVFHELISLLLGFACTVGKYPETFLFLCATSTEFHLTIFESLTTLSSSFNNHNVDMLINRVITPSFTFTRLYMYTWTISRSISYYQTVSAYLRITVVSPRRIGRSPRVKLCMKWSDPHMSAAIVGLTICCFCFTSLESVRQPRQQQLLH